VQAASGWQTASPPDPPELRRDQMGPRAATTKRSEDRAQAAFRDAQERWREALEAHRLDPPDAGFASRLAELSDAARQEAEACRSADAAGFQWPPHRAADGGPPYELRPGTGRRGPESLWQRFDDAAGSSAAPRRGQTCSPWRTLMSCSPSLPLSSRRP
jgi:hypothetical protein